MTSAEGSWRGRYPEYKGLAPAASFAIEFEKKIGSRSRLEIKDLCHLLDEKNRN
jgi:hypothetical protein